MKKLIPLMIAAVLSFGAVYAAPQAPKTTKAKATKPAAKPKATKKAS